MVCLRIADMTCGPLSGPDEALMICTMSWGMPWLGSLASWMETIELARRMKRRQITTRKTTSEYHRSELIVIVNRRSFTYDFSV